MFDKASEILTTGGIGALFGLSVAFIKELKPTKDFRCGAHEKEFEETHKFRATTNNEIKNLSETIHEVKEMLSEIRTEIGDISKRFYSSEIVDVKRDPKHEHVNCLIIEDCPMNADVLKMVCHQLHIKETIVSNFDDAVKAVNSIRYDLVLADDDLGEIRTGTDFWHYCRTEFKRLPVIVYTGKDIDKKMIPASMMFLQKPVDVQVLKSMIGECGIKI